MEKGIIENNSNKTVCNIHSGLAWIYFSHNDTDLVEGRRILKCGQCVLEEGFKKECLVVVESVMQAKQNKLIKNWPPLREGETLEELEVIEQEQDIKDNIQEEAEKKVKEEFGRLRVEILKAIDAKEKEFIGKVKMEEKQRISWIENYNKTAEKDKFRTLLVECISKGDESELKEFCRRKKAHAESYSSILRSYKLEKQNNNKMMSLDGVIKRIVEMIEQIGNDNNDELKENNQIRDIQPPSNSNISSSSSYSNPENAESSQNSIDKIFQVFSKNNSITNEKQQLFPSYPNIQKGNDTFKVDSSLFQKINSNQMNQQLPFQIMSNSVNSTKLSSVVSIIKTQKGGSLTDIQIKVDENSQNPYVQYISCGYEHSQAVLDKVLNPEKTYYLMFEVSKSQLSKQGSYSIIDSNNLSSEYPLSYSIGLIKKDQISIQYLHQMKMCISSKKDFSYTNEVVYGKLINLNNNLKSTKLHLTICISKQIFQVAQLIENDNKQLFSNKNTNDNNNYNVNKLNRISWQKSESFGDNKQWMVALFFFSGDENIGTKIQLEQYEEV